MKNKSIKLNTFKRQEIVDFFLKIAANVENYFYRDFGVVIINEQITISLPLGDVTQVKVDFFIKEDFFDDFIYKFRIHFSRGGA